ncbi:MAG: RagB/SusD family nutrient uptake outer membrane protein [Bacteroidales bacterium]|jgi:hypothetical protein|nr:RagB/SusD family nutrient uptake outer membrane protein [Bacteroidales bacterium]
MKNKIIQLFGYSVILNGLLCACSDFLEPAYDGTMDEDVVFANATYFCGPLNDAYSALNSHFEIAMDNMTDNSVARVLSDQYYLCGTGALRPDNNPVDNWVSAYQQIRRINQFLSRMKLNPDPKLAIPTPVRFYPLINRQDTLDNVREFWRLYGEAYFLRAFYNSELLKNYGGVASDGRVLGVPLVGDRVLEVTENLNFPRASYAECVQAIISDCDTAVKYLPLQFTGNDRVTGTTKHGRANGIAARALKARVLLFAASPMFNPNNDRNLWVAAATAAGDAIKELGANQFALVSAPASGAADDQGDAYYFTQLQATGTAWNDNARDLFLRANILAGNKAYETDHYPPSMYGSALTNPSRNFVDAFPDINGYPITADGTVYLPDRPYENRDPRLALWVAYNGSRLGPGNYHTVETSEGGVDAYNPLRGTSRTSYYLRKLLRPKTVSLIPGVTGAATQRTHIILGKPELYLNFAEAANEAWGVTGDPMGYAFTAKTVLDEVIKKYYYPASAWNVNTHYVTVVINTDQDKFREYLRNYRRLDLSFEGHYFYDLRRWIPDGNPAALNVDVYGTKIVKTGENTYSYERVLLERRNFKSPYQPIPYAELYNAPAVVQNKGWE